MAEKQDMLLIHKDDLETFLSGIEKAEPDRFSYFTSFTGIQIIEDPLATKGTAILALNNKIITIKFTPRENKQ